MHRLAFLFFAIVSLGIKVSAQTFPESHFRACYRQLDDDTPNCKESDSVSVLYTRLDDSHTLFLDINFLNVRLTRMTVLLSLTEDVQGTYTFGATTNTTNSTVNQYFLYAGNGTTPGGDRLQRSSSNPGSEIIIRITKYEKLSNGRFRFVGSMEGTLYMPDRKKPWRFDGTTFDVQGEQQALPSGPK